MAQYLRDFDWQPIVIAPRHTAYHDDPTLQPLNDVEVWRTGSLEWALAVRRARADGNPVPGNRSSVSGLRRLRTLVHRAIYIPDGQIGWYPFAIRAARAAQRARSVDVVFSSSPPMTAHLVGLRLHRETGLPWVAEFRDLWTDWRENGSWRQPLDERFERKVLTTATATLTVSPTYERTLAGRGARRVATITNGFDTADFDVAAPPVDDVLAHVGTYHPESQELSTALGAFAALVRRGPLADTRLRIVGDSFAELASAARDAGVEDRVDQMGFASHRESVDLMRRSRLLLHLGPSSSAAAALGGHVPGKTFEYIASGRPVLHVGDPGSDVANILRPFPQVRIVRYGDRAGAERALAELSTVATAPLNGAAARYSHRELARALAGLLTEVAA